ncbi:MAG: glycosyltransferase family 4 protein, partial [Actinomycetota bacterium]|nr:glycosyltransferase family 4 protein [Actinomycetota bacterium]
MLQVFGPSEGGIARHVAMVTEGLDGRDGLVMDVAGPPEVPVPMPKPMRELHVPSGLRGHRGAQRRIASLVEEGYDVVHAHGLRAGIDAGLAARGSAAKVYVTVHNLVLADISGRAKAMLLKRAEPLAVRLTTRTFCASEQISEHLRRTAPRHAYKIETLHAPVGQPPVVVRSRTEVRTELGLGEDERLVVTVARLAPQKALHVMLEAVAGLPAGVHLAIVGSGPLEADLKARSDSLG